MEQAPDSLSGAGEDARLEALIVEFFRRREAGDEDALGSLAALHPERADALRTRLAALDDLGLLDDDREDALPLPERVGSYRIVRRLGAGSMGIVYLAEQTSTGRMVALKLVRGLHDPLAAERFRREAAALARLAHPGIVAVLDSGSIQQTMFLAMEHVPGQGLDQRLRPDDDRPPASMGQRVAWVRDVARALGAVHAAGLVHRDLKPSNIRITPDDRAVLVDFGLARDLAASSFSRTGAFLGTPHYAAPEQIDIRAGAIGPATDLYGLGATLYECLTGQLPFTGSTTEAVFHRILSEDVSSPRRHNPQVSVDLETVVLKAMERDPTRRYASARALADDLDAVLGLRAIRARPPGPVRRASRVLRRHRMGSAVLATALALGAGFGILRAREQTRQAARRMALARDVLADARRQLARYHDRKAASSDLEQRLEQLRVLLSRRYLEPEEEAQLNRDAASVELLGTQRELAFADIRSSLQQAQDLGAAPAEVAEIRAQIDLLKLMEADASDQEKVADFYRARLAALGGTAAGRAAALTGGQLVIDTTPVPTELFLYRYGLQSRLAESGQPRMVPRPWGARAPGHGGEFGGPGDADVPGAPAAAGPDESSEARLPKPGAWALELRADAPPLRRGDLIVELAGHPIEDCVLVARGADPTQPLDRLLQVDGQQVVSMRDAHWLAAPRATDTAPHRFLFSRRGSTGTEAERFTLLAADLTSLGIELAAPIQLARAGVPATLATPGKTFRGPLPELPALRLTAQPVLLSEAARVDRGPRHELSLDPATYLAVLVGPAGETLRFGLRVASGQEQLISLPMERVAACPPGFVPVFDGVGRVFFMLEHEVTCAEYLEFLSAPENRGALRAASDVALVPRTLVTDGWRALWPSDGQGGFRLPEGTLPDHPVSSVSFDDAQAYARWATTRLRAQGWAVTCELPGHADWHAAANPVGCEWRYVFGPHFRPRWAHGNYAHRTPARGPVMTHPVDASPAGVYDLSGSVMEWSAGWFWEEQGWRAFRCGAWSYADPERFETQFAQGELPGWTSGALGFRVVARPDQ